MIRIVADDKIPFLRGVLEPYADIKYIPGNKITRELLTDTDALLIRTRTKCSPFLLDGTSVRFIATATIGFDHIDIKYCEDRNIAWTNAPGCNSSSVQQYMASALLKIAEKFHFNLKEKTIGIVGVGNVGSKVEKLARILGMKVILCDPPRARKEGSAGFAELNELLRASDIVSLHVPLNLTGDDRTYHLINKDTFGLMRKGAWFINTSRGEVAETNALKQAIDGRLTGAVTDVWENEPHIDFGLLAGSFIATPHIAGYSTDGKANGTAMSVNSLSRFFDFPMTDWYPDNVPAPDQPSVQIDGKDRDDEEIIRETVLHTYDCEGDDKKLRTALSDFEKLRGDYPLRREFPAYNVTLKNGSENVNEILLRLGFNLKNL